MSHVRRAPLRPPAGRSPAAGSSRVRLLLALAAAAVLTAAPLLAGPSLSPSASAATSWDSLVRALRSSPVYVDPSNPAGVSSSDAQRLLSEVRSAGTPIFIAVVPSSTLGGRSVDSAPRQLGDAVGLRGTYAVVADRSFRADSNVVGSVKTVADRAAADNRSGGANAILDAFVRDISAAAAGRSSSPSSSSGVGAVGVVVLLVLLAGAGGLVFWGVRRSRRRRAAELAEVKEVVDEDVTEFGERLAAFDMRDPRLDDAGRADLQNALNAYDRAKVAVDAMKAASEAGAATQALEDGRFAMACVEARLAGRELPARRPPCFVDPRHGPSTADVEWAPDGGAVRPVPVCDACAATLRAGASPAARMVPAGAGGGSVPYWQGGQQYAPYAGGYYSSFGSILPALFVGGMLGSAFSHPTVVNTTYVDSGGPADSGGGWFGGGGGGDSGGGGSWFGGGGGDFGGGGGGGDF